VQVQAVSESGVTHAVI